MKITPGKKVTGTDKLWLDCPVCSVRMKRLRLGKAVNLRIYGCPICKSWLCIPAGKETQAAVDYRRTGMNKG